jgi:hypothetical protein
MNTLFTKLLYCSCLLFVANFCKAQTKFVATINPAQAGINEYITLKLTVENAQNVQQINPPALNDFNLVSGPNQESAVNNVNGVVTQSISLSYILQPKKPGTYNIGYATAIIADKTYKSNAVKVSVSNKKSSNSNATSNSSPFAAFDLFDEPKPRAAYDDYILRKGETVQDKVSKNMRLKLQTDKTVCYVGEPILASYKLYSRLQSESNLAKNPSFNGFSVVDMMQQNDQYANTQETLDGRAYNVYIIRKAQLYPLQDGAIELEAASLDNKITFLKYENGAGNNGTMVTENVSLSSKPIIINVKPLPEKNKPTNFSGAVGNFSIEATVEKNTFTTDETGKLLITINGKGNMQLLTAPEIEWQQGFEAFDTKIIDNTNNTTIPLSGSKIFEIPFAVFNAGNYALPKISFSFFDVASGMYKTVSAAEIKITITKGLGINNKISTSKKATVSSSPSKFPYLLIAILFAVIGFLSAIFFWVRKTKKEKIVLPKMEKEEIKLENKSNIPEDFSFNKNYLEKTEACLATANCNDFYTIINAEFKSFLSNKYRTAKEQLNSKSLLAEMDKAGVDNSIMLQTQQLLQDIEWQLYTPFVRNEKLNDMYARAQTIIQMLIKHV